VGYGGNFDPDYVYTSTGSLFATTFNGLKTNRDGCVYTELPGVPNRDRCSITFAPCNDVNDCPPDNGNAQTCDFHIAFVSTATQGPDDAIYIAVTSPAEAKVYKSTDNGMTFPMSADIGQINDWFSSLEVAPSNPNRLYASGYRFVPNPDPDAGGNIKVFAFYTSANGGQSWTSLPVTDFTTTANSLLEIAGISATDPSLLYARVTLEDGMLKDALYRSTDGGQTWTKILTKTGSLAFVVRANGHLVAGTALSGAEMSTDNGTTWTPLAGAPHINCLAESSAGEVWACTKNYDSMQVPGDGHGIMKTTDLVNWAPVLKFENIKEPAPCPAGTVQKDTCDAKLWCGLCAQLGCDAKRECPGFGPDGMPDAGVIIKPPKDGCCFAGATPTPGMLALLLVVGMVLLRPRRR
jgi:uncharacterized protein (TIGR03382 family)